MKRMLYALLAAGTLLLAVPAQAALLFFEATLTGAEEVPPRDTPATGFGTVVLDDVALTITVNLGFENLTTPSIMAHIHQAPIGVNGPIVFPLELGDALGQTAGAIDTQVFTLPNGAADVQTFLAGGFYFNVHSEMFPPGEIRGQIFQVANGVPLPSPLLLALTALGTLALARRKY